MSRSVLHGTELGKQLLVVVEFQLRALDLVAVHLVEHLHESVLVLHLGAGHPGHAEILELQLLPFQLVLAEEAVAVGTARHERIGGVEVTETIENIIRELPENLSKSKRIALARSRIKDAFHIEGRKWPYWIQEPDWPANNGKPMKYVSTVRLNADQREHHFVDVDTGEERIVMDCT